MKVMVDGRFNDKVALVTGGSRGIGLAIAKAILDEGGSVVITGRRQEGLDDAAAQLQAGNQLRTLVGHAGHHDHRAAAIDLAITSFGSLDHVVGNVGINPVFGPTIEVDLEAVRKIFEVNYLATLGLLQQAWQAWLRDHGGSIVIINSVAGLGGAGGIGSYGASKAALTQLVSQLAVELAPSVRVNSLAPAVVKTKFAEALYADDEDKAVARYPLKRLGMPSDIGSAAAFLLSEGASWITGQNLVCDGGLRSTSGI